MQGYQSFMLEDGATALAEIQRTCRPTWGGWM